MSACMPVCVFVQITAKKKYENNDKYIQNITVEVVFQRANFPE